MHFIGDALGIDKKWSDMCEFDYIVTTACDRYGLATPEFEDALLKILHNFGVDDNGESLGIGPFQTLHEYFIYIADHEFIYKLSTADDKHLCSMYRDLTAGNDLKDDVNKLLNKFLTKYGQQKNLLDHCLSSCLTLHSPLIKIVIGYGVHFGLEAIMTKVIKLCPHHTFN